MGKDLVRVAKEMMNRNQIWLSLLNGGFNLSRLVESMKKSATDGLPKIRSLRSEIERRAVSPGDASEKRRLLAEVDGAIENLEFCRNMTLARFVDLILLAIEGNDDDCAGADRSWSPVAVSILPILELPGRGCDVYGLRLNLIGGSHGNAVAMDVGGVFNVVTNHMGGIQVAGLANCDRQASGMQTTAGVNIAGVARGAQVVGLCNLAFKLTGCQISGSWNIAVVGSGCQVGGYVNAAEIFSGVQVGALNSCHDFSGFQLAAFNVASDCCGVQIAAVNKAKNLLGLQVGALNFATTASGCQIGFLNVIKEFPQL